MLAWYLKPTLCWPYIQPHTLGWLGTTYLRSADPGWWHTKSFYQKLPFVYLGVHLRSTDPGWWHTDLSDKIPTLCWPGIQPNTLRGLDILYLHSADQGWWHRDFCDKIPSLYWPGIQPHTLRGLVYYTYADPGWWHTDYSDLIPTLCWPGMVTHRIFWPDTYALLTRDGDTQTILTSYLHSADPGWWHTDYSDLIPTLCWPGMVTHRLFWPDTYALLTQQNMLILPNLSCRFLYCALPTLCWLRLQPHTLCCSPTYGLLTQDGDIQTILT